MKKKILHNLYDIQSFDLYFMRKDIVNTKTNIVNTKVTDTVIDFEKNDTIICVLQQKLVRQLIKKNLIFSRSSLSV